MTGDQNDRPDAAVAHEFVDANDWLPEFSGMIPLYEGHPPDTVLPATKCPHCHTLMPTAYDLFRWEKQRHRLIEERQEFDRDTEIYQEMTQDIQDLGKERADATLALPHGWRKWADNEVIPDGY